MKYYYITYSLHVQVKMGFLPVGHTHEDIDQLFSCVSRYLQRHSVLTIPGYDYYGYSILTCVQFS